MTDNSLWTLQFWYWSNKQMSSAKFWDIIEVFEADTLASTLDTLISVPPPYHKVSMLKYETATATYFSPQYPPRTKMYHGHSYKVGHCSRCGQRNELFTSTSSTYYSSRFKFTQYPTAWTGEVLLNLTNSELDRLKYLNPIDVGFIVRK